MGHQWLLVLFVVSLQNAHLTHSQDPSSNAVIENALGKSVYSAVSGDLASCWTQTFTTLASQLFLCVRDPVSRMVKTRPVSDSPSNNQMGKNEPSSSDNKMETTRPHSNSSPNNHMGTAEPFFSNNQMKTSRSYPESSSNNYMYEGTTRPYSSNKQMETARPFSFNNNHMETLPPYCPFIQIPRDRVHVQKYTYLEAFVTYLHQPPLQHDTRCTETFSSLGSERDRDSRYCAWWRPYRLHLQERSQKYKALALAALNLQRELEDQVRALKSINAEEKLKAGAGEMKTCKAVLENAMNESTQLKAQSIYLTRENEELYDIKEPLCKNKPNFIGFWPMNQQHEGKNLATEDADFELKNVMYPSDDGMWKSPPTSYRKAMSSHAVLSNNHLLRVTQSFSWIGAMYKRSHLHGPIFEWYTGNWFLSYMWIWNNEFLLVVDRASCSRVSSVHSSKILPFQWYVLAATVNLPSNTISLYVNGQREDKAIIPCPHGMISSNYIYINSRKNDGNMMDAELTCFGLFNVAVSYEEMYNNTIAQCKK